MLTNMWLLAQQLPAEPLISVFRTIIGQDSVCTMRYYNKPAQIYYLPRSRHSQAWIELQYGLTQLRQIQSFISYWLKINLKLVK